MRKNSMQKIACGDSALDAMDARKTQPGTYNNLTGKEMPIEPNKPHPIRSFHNEIRQNRVAVPPRQGEGDKVFQGSYRGQNGRRINEYNLGGGTEAVIQYDPKSKKVARATVAAGHHEDVPTWEGSTPEKFNQNIERAEEVGHTSSKYSGYRGKKS